MIFLNISELKSEPTEAAILKENHKFNNLIIAHKITINPKTKVIGILMSSADVIESFEEIKYTNGKLKIFSGFDNTDKKGITLAILKTSAILLIKSNMR